MTLVLLLLALGILLVMRHDARVAKSEYDTPEQRRSNRRLIEDYERLKAEARQQMGGHT